VATPAVVRVYKWLTSWASELHMYILALDIETLARTRTAAKRLVILACMGYPPF